MDLRIVKGRKCFFLKNAEYVHVNGFINAPCIKLGNLNKLEHVPAIPTDQLRTQIAKHIETSKSSAWIYYVGGELGSGSILLTEICCLVCWRCKYHQNKETGTPPPVTYTAPGSPNISIPRVDAIGADKNSAPGQVTVGFQEPVGNRRMVTDYHM